ncbi:hypothetical protein GYA54_00170 [Candidatus Kuenenbacteria bacterium]|nr:hypothetical protein [Candidatus Kuenenbacteria bacterium]
MTRRKRLVIFGKLLTIFVLFLGIKNFVLAGEATTTAELMPMLAEEPAIYTLRLDEATITKGYTFIAPDNDFKVGVIDRAVIEPITVRFKKIPDYHMAYPLTKAPGEKASAIWEFDLLADDGSVGKLVKPIYLAAGITNTKMNRKLMYYWDKSGGQWRVLPSSVDLKEKLIRSKIYLPYARVALFDEPDDTTYEAWASWYPTELTKRNILGCASNAYPLNTPLWVCRLDDLTRCTITRVISRGPYVDDRIVDLTYDAFENIGNPRGGVVGVRVFLRKESETKFPSK